MPDALMTIQLDHFAVKAASRIKAKKDVRYYLNGVYVEATRTQTIVVATDGHRMIMMRSDAENEVEDATSLIIPGDAVKRIADGSTRLVRRVPLRQVNAERWSLPLLKWGVEISFKSLEGRFPNWRSVIPKQVSGDASNFNPSYLADFQAAACDYFGAGTRDRGTKVEVCQNGQAGALVFSTRPDDSFMGVLMPVRDEVALRRPPPAWATAPAPDVIAARYNAALTPNRKTSKAKA